MTSITVLGGTGYAGTAIAREAVSRGHEVTSISRSAPAEPLDGVTYVQSSVLDADASELVAGAEVVVAALSPRGEMAGKVAPAYAELAVAADQAGARLVVIGGFGSLRPAAGAPRFAEGDMPPEYVAESQEMLRVLEALGGTPESLSWLFVSPAGSFGSFAPGEATGTYRTGGEVAIFDVEGASNISGADFALAVVDEIEKGEHIRAHIGFAY